jgi:hypothetical protein
MSAGEPLLALPSAGRRPGWSRVLRALFGVVLAVGGVAASAAAFVALWPSDPVDPGPERLSGADAAAARAVVARARALTSVSPEQLGYRLRIAGPLTGVRGRTDTAGRTITLFVAPGTTPHRVAHDLAHEVGHAYDVLRLNAARRAAYLRARGVPAAAWWADPEANDYRSGAGDFAEVFALCHATSPEFRSRLATRPAQPCAALPIAARGAKLGEGVS